MLLSMKVLPVLNVVDLGDELLLDGIARMQAVKRLAHHKLKVVIRLLNLADVDLLELDEESKEGKLGQFSYWL